MCIFINEIIGCAFQWFTSRNKQYVIWSASDNQSIDCDQLFGGFCCLVIWFRKRLVYRKSNSFCFCRIYDAWPNQQMKHKHILTYASIAQRVRAVIWFNHSLHAARLPAVQCSSRAQPTGITIVLSESIKQLHNHFECWQCVSKSVIMAAKKLSLNRKNVGIWLKNSSFASNSPPNKE